MFRYTLTSILLSGFLVPTIGQEANQLSELEEKAGYDLLWNGQDFSQWHDYRLNRVTDIWQIKTDGVLGPRIETSELGGGGNPLMSNKLYKNFDFKADIKTRTQGNSGIFFRYREEAVEYWEKRSGPELQICDIQNNDCKLPIHGFGACYEMFPVVEEHRTSWYNPAGQWNQIRVIAYDSNYVHYGNGKKLLEYKIGTSEFQDAYNDSKYSIDGNNGNYYDIHEGSFLLQQHSEGEMAFRNLKAKTLDMHPFLQEFPDGKWPDELPHDYVLGKRGCTNPEAINYDEMAVVDDSTCETEVTIKNSNAWKNLRVVHKKIDENKYLIEIPFKHSGVRAYSLNGKRIYLEKANSNYFILVVDLNIGLVVLKIKTEAAEISKLIKF